MKTNEKGRSMIEMLGVLAIIGVLSVGGIYGYTVAMRKYKANEIAQTLSMLATMAHAANGGLGDTVTLAQSGLNTNPGGVELGSATKAECDTAVDDSCTTVKVTFALNDTSDTRLDSAVRALLPKNASSANVSGFYVAGAASGS